MQEVIRSIIDRAKSTNGTLEECEILSYKKFNKLDSKLVALAKASNEARTNLDEYLLQENTLKNLRLLWKERREYMFIEVDNTSNFRSGNKR